MRKFLPYELAAEAKGRKIYHLNIGQPDIETPKAFFDAVKNFQDPVLAYAAAPGVSEFLTAVQGYYANLGIHLEQSDIYATAGGSEALQMALTCILDEGDEILIPEPFYPNYNTFVSVTGGVIRPIPTTPEEGYRYADRARIEPLINEHTRAILVTNPGNPTGVVLSPEEMLGAGTVCARMVLQPGCEVGEHTHHGNYEVYYFLSGRGVYRSNGETTTVDAGTVTFTGDGERHALRNDGPEPLEFMAFVLNLPAQA